MRRGLANRFVASYRAPNCNCADFWVDLSSDSNGSVIKVWNCNLCRWTEIAADCDCEGGGEGCEECFTTDQIQAMIDASMQDFNDQLEQLQNQLTAIFNQIAGMGMSIEQLSNQITTINNNITTINERLDAIEADNVTLHDQVDNNETEIGSIGTELNNLSNNVLDIQNASVQITQNITIIQGDVEGLETSVSDLDTRVDALEDCCAETRAAVFPDETN